MKTEVVFVSLIGQFHDLYDGMMWLEGVDVFLFHLLGSANSPTWSV